MRCVLLTEQALAIILMLFGAIVASGGMRTDDHRIAPTRVESRNRSSYRYLSSVSSSMLLLSRYGCAIVDRRYLLLQLA
jgi:hypothetical protein